MLITGWGQGPSWQPGSSRSSQRRLLAAAATQTQPEHGACCSRWPQSGGPEGSVFGRAVIYQDGQPWLPPFPSVLSPRNSSKFLPAPPSLPRPPVPQPHPSSQSLQPSTGLPSVCPTPPFPLRSLPFPPGPQTSTWVKARGLGSPEDWG